MLVVWEEISPGCKLVIVFFFVWGGGDVFEVGFWMEENEGKRPFFFSGGFLCVFFGKKGPKKG